jgi:hypothetical protein
MEILLIIIIIILLAVFFPGVLWFVFWTVLILSAIGLRVVCAPFIALADWCERKRKAQEQQKRKHLGYNAFVRSKNAAAVGYVKYVEKERHYGNCFPENLKPN